MRVTNDPAKPARRQFLAGLGGTLACAAAPAFATAPALDTGRLADAVARARELD